MNHQRGESLWTGLISGTTKLRISVPSLASFCRNRSCFLPQLKKTLLTASQRQVKRKFMPQLKKRMHTSLFLNCRLAICQKLAKEGCNCQEVKGNAFPLPVHS